jgi:hypothetical protein
MVAACDEVFVKEILVTETDHDVRKGTVAQSEILAVYCSRDRIADPQALDSGPDEATWRDD